METSPLQAPDRSLGTTLFFAAGLASACLALLSVYLLDVYADGWHVMGWYADYVIPAGALLVGALAGAGYGLWAWLAGIKIRPSMLWRVAALQAAAYFAARYIEFEGMHLVYKDTGNPISFFTYFDFVTRAFAWEKEGGGGAGQPLGIWGYLFTSLEILGFIAGGVAVPWLLSKRPFCEKCQLYYKRRQLGLLPASVPHRRVKKSDAAGTAAFQAENQGAAAQADTVLAAMKEHVSGGQPQRFREAFQPFAGAQKQARRLPRRVNLELFYCGHCQNGFLRANLLSGQGKQMKTALLFNHEAGPFFVQNMTAKV